MDKNQYISLAGWCRATKHSYHFGQKLVKSGVLPAKKVFERWYINKKYLNLELVFED